MEFYSSRAIYLQIADHLISEILSNTLNHGDRIQSVREFAAEIEVNPNTIAKSYTWLSDKGIIKMQRGIGYFITDSAYDMSVAIMKKQLFDHDIPKMIEKATLLNLPIESLIKNYKHEEEK